jgi:O-antigen ligase
MLVAIFFGVLTAGSSWELNHGLMLSLAGGLMLIFKPVACLPRSWWWLAGGFVALSLGAFLPASWFGVPEWRRELDELGLELGSQEVIQTRMALENWVLFAVTLMVGLWLARQRSEAPQAAALAFVPAVAGYALISKLSQDPGETFGFFPNRNHTATLLSMGVIVGLGATVQALREKRWVTMGFAVAALGLCLLAALGWSLSRAGLLLVAVGSLVWLACLGKSYLGKHAVKLVALTALAGFGGFLVTDNPIKERLQDNVEMINEVLESSEEADESAAKSIDFRVPTWLDTLEMIAENPWVGVGPGQFRYVFTQYRDRTAVMGETKSVHPESDWLWMASEVGIPATLLLAALVVLALVFSLKRVTRGRVRAVRVACLVAAGLVVLHGCFDVPGHRLPLALAAAWLFGLSIPPSHKERKALERSRPLGSGLAGHLAGLVLLGLGIWLLLAGWGQVPATATTAAIRARTEALSLYREDQRLLDESRARGEESYEPEVDLLAQAIDRLAGVSEVAPLDPETWRLRGSLALQFDDRQAEVERSFLIERILLPKVVEVPLKQAKAWGEFDPEQVRALWSEALDRATQLDDLSPANGSKVAWTWQSIRQGAGQSAKLTEIEEGLKASSIAKPEGGDF